jgi:peptidoglycan/xylan/chitin deacetylase (PgdA/CDA1 family)
MNIHTILRQNPEVWDLFTRKEEYHNLHRDQFGRFPYYASKNRDIFEPKASQYLVGQDYSPKYPDNAPFAVFLTHDIDNVYQSIRSKGGSAFHNLKKANFTEAIRSVSQVRSKKLPLCNFSAIMDLEENYGAKSTFFFMAEEAGDQDYSYTIKDLEPEIRLIIDRGWEVGLHGGHTTYLDPQEMKKKKERLEKVTHHPVLGYRNHYLRFRVPTTWKYLSQAGFQYDTTVAFADCIGFRNGMCHPYRPFDLTSNQEIDIMEIPLTIMDRTLGSTHMRLDTKASWESVSSIIDRVVQCHGVFTVLWHNENMFGEDLAFYEKILHYCKERNAWLTSGEHISAWWKQNVKD